MADNVNPPNNVWYYYMDPLSTFYAFEFQAGDGDTGHSLILHTKINTGTPDGSGNYWGYAGMAAPIITSPGTGYDFNQYRFINFDVVTYIWPLDPTAPAVISLFYMKLLNNNGQGIVQDFSVPIDWNFYSVQMSMSSFSLPSGVTGYAVSDVLSNVTELRWEYMADSTSNTGASEDQIQLDNINLEK